MANIEITNNSTSGVAVWDPVFEDDRVRTAGGGTFAAGTLLAREVSTGLLKPYEDGGEDGLGVPLAVLPFEAEVPSAGDWPVRPIISGRVRAADLIEHGVGPATSKAVLDQLRGYSIIALGTTQLAELDNQ